jgi:hypothetical protein
MREVVPNIFQQTSKTKIDTKQGHTLPSLQKAEHNGCCAKEVYRTMKMDSKTSYTWRLSKKKALYLKSIIFLVLCLMSGCTNRARTSHPVYRCESRFSHLGQYYSVLRPKSGIKQAKNCIQSCKQKAEFGCWAALGWGYLQTNQIAKSISVFKQAIPKAKDKSSKLTIYEGLAKTYKKKGKMNQAAFFYKQL